MANLIIWNTFNPIKGLEKTNPVPDVASRTSGPHQLASWLTEFGYSVKVVDFCHIMYSSDLVSITEKHISDDTIAIGCSTTFWDDGASSNFQEPEWVIESRSILEERYPKIDWLLGGVDAYLKSESKFDWKRFVGYDEDQIIRYLDEKLGKDEIRNPFNMKDVSCHYTDGLGITPTEVLPIQLSRGCQFKCTFCRAPLLGKKKNTYVRDYGVVEKELLNMYDRYGTTRYYFIDDTVNETEDKIIALAEIAQKLPFKLEWVGYLRLDLIAKKPNTIELLKLSGLRSAFFGIESFNSATAKAINKPWYGWGAKDFLIELKDHWKDDINWTLSFIVGLPHETIETLDETQQWLIENKMYSWLWNPLYINKTSNIPDKSLFEQNYSKYGYIFPNPNNNSYWINDYWDSETAKSKSIQLTVDKFEHEKVATWRLAEYSNSLECSFDELMPKFTKEIERKIVRTKMLKQVKNYVNYQLSI